MLMGFRAGDLGLATFRIWLHHMMRSRLKQLQMAPSSLPQQSIQRLLEHQLLVQHRTGDVHTSLGIYGHSVHIAKLQATRRNKNADSVSNHSFLHKVDD
jgi:hypothetical protein